MRIRCSRRAACNLASGAGNPAGEKIMAKPLPLKVKDEYLPPELAQLRQQIEALPRSIRDQMLPLCDRVTHFLHLQGRLFEVAQETVDRLQLDVNYLAFDL